MTEMEDEIRQLVRGLEELMRQHPEKEKEIISTVRARLEGDVARELGISIDDLRAQCTG